MDEKTVPLQSVHRALDILEALADEKEGLGLTALARRVGLKAGTAGNILRALKERGYVDQRAGSTDYVLGTTLMMLAGRNMDRLNLVRLAQRPLQQLHEYSGETVFLSARRGAYLATVTFIEGIHPIIARAESQPKLATLHATAMGKVLLAYLGDAEVDATLAAAGMPALTDCTITDPLVLKKQLDEVRRCGYALNSGEESPGVHGIAAPVFDHLGAVVAGVCVGYPGERENSLDMAALIERVVGCAADISHALGYVALPLKGPERSDGQAGKEVQTPSMLQQ